MKAEITLIPESRKKEFVYNNRTFCIISYDTHRDGLSGPTINLLVSHQKWMQRMNEAPPKVEVILSHIEQNGQKFIEEKINAGEIIFSDKPSPALEPKYYEIL